MAAFVREKKIKQGDYLDVEIFTYTTEQTRRLPKYRRRKITPPKQFEQNNRNALKKFIALVNTNFSGSDFRFDVTYREAPEPERAAKDRVKLIRELKKLYKKKGAEFRYIAVTEGGREKQDGTFSRIHHHLLISGGVSRDEIENCWKLGRRSCQRLQPVKHENGLEPLARYLLKGQRRTEDKNTCRWSGSRNLKKPIETVNDNKYALGEQARMKRAEQSGTLCRRIERLYRGYELVEAEFRENPVTGWTGVSLKLHKKE